MSLPLEGVRVLDFSVFQQGSYASAMLADMGADVIKVESPDHPDPGRGMGLDHAESGLRSYFEHLNRNKRGISLDLKSESGRKALLRLVETADIFHHNTRPGVVERLRLTYEDLRAVNPRIIVSHASGWGDLGPDAEALLGSMDILAQARGGIMSVTGTPETGPLPVGVPIADHVGAIISAYGMMVALWERERSGQGQQASTSLYGGQLTIQGFNITSAMWAQRDPERVASDGRRPHWRSYGCADGKDIMLGGPTADRWWADFCDALGCPELATGRYFTNAQDPAWRRMAGSRIGDIFATRTRDEWIAELSPRFMVQPIRSYLEVAEDEQAWANGYLAYIPREDGDDLPTVGVPVRLSRTPGGLRHRAPELGQHTEEVLLEAGLSWDEIGALREEGAFGEMPSAAASVE